MGLGFGLSALSDSISVFSDGVPGKGRKKRDMPKDLLVGCFGLNGCFIQYFSLY